MKNREYFMKIAIEEAKQAMKEDEVPVGAVIVKEGKIISKAHNQKEQIHAPLAHAEMIAINEACQKLNTTYLDDCELYVTFEPCMMCTGAIINSRLKTVIFGASDLRFASLESIFLQIQQKQFNYQPMYFSGVLGKECANLMTKYFNSKRK